MSLNQIERNLLALIDPVGRHTNDSLRFIRSDIPSDESALQRLFREEKGTTVFCFGRGALPGFLLCTLAARLVRKKKRIRAILYVSDGLLSSLFDAGLSAGYHAFARRHLPPPTGIRRRLAMLLPPVLRAEHRFVVIEQPDRVREIPENKALNDLDFMFYSNAEGKLMLTRSATIVSGSGLIFKSTSTASYRESLEREHAAVRRIVRLCDRQEQVPRVGERITVNGRSFFPEDYLCGESLREKLRTEGRAGDSREVCKILDRLDAWYSRYRSAFRHDKKALSSLYEPVLRSFAGINATEPELAWAGSHAESLLAALDRNIAGVAPVTAHNDLWPGNFIVNGECLTAVDWERATEQRAPLFDYFWMTISAALEYHVGCTGRQDYSIAFRQFLAHSDPVSRHAHAKLEEYIEALGINRKMFRQFIMLFLMEWSIQGYLALGKVTDMDRLVTSELVAYTGNHGDELRSQLNDFPTFMND